MTLSENSTKGKSKRTDDLYYLTEKTLRKILNNMYNAILTTHNAEILQKEDPHNFNHNKFAGTSLVIESMKGFSNWLNKMKLFTNNKVYDEQILQPVKIVADVIQKYRNLPTKTTDLKGWVFSRSETYGDDYGNVNDKVTLSMVIPSIQSVMSVRLSEQIAKIPDRKFMIFTAAQPIPLVNRIHQTQHTDKIIDETVRLEDFDFLFTSFDDISQLGKSIEMENYCEVRSAQSDKRQHLGFVFISTAKIITITGPTIVLRGNNKTKSTITMKLSPHFAEIFNYDDRDNMTGKTVRFLAVSWYDIRQTDDIKFESPEIFFVETEQDMERLEIEDIIGRIRLRGRVAMEELNNMLPKLSKYPCITIKDNHACFEYASSQDPVCRYYQKATNDIRKLRESMRGGALQITHDQVIDRNKMDINNLPGLIMHHENLYKILMVCITRLNSIREFDIEDITKALESYDKDSIKQQISFMIYLKILEKMNSNYRITSLGNKIAFKCLSKDLKTNTSQQKIISIIDAEKEGIPASVLLKCLRANVLKDYHPVQIQNETVEIFWSKSTLMPNDEECLRIKIINLKQKIFDELLRVSHSLSDLAISENISKDSEYIGPSTIFYILSNERSTGKLIYNDGSWEYPIEERITDLFEKHPSDLFTIEKIIEKITVGTMRKNDIQKILDGLDNKKTIVKIKEKWTKNISIDKKVDREYNLEARRLILTVVKSKPIDLNRATSYVDGLLAKTNTSKRGSDRHNVIKIQLEKLVDEKIVQISNGLISKI